MIIMKESPFIFGKTVSEIAFANRENERKRIRINLSSGINTMIISPRRWGKSSLVEKSFKEIERQNKNTKCVIIDLFSVGSEEEFLELFAREVIKSTSTKWEEWVGTVKEFFHQLMPNISFGVDPYTDFKLNFNWEELKKHSSEILELPEKIAKKRNLKIIIGIDEFQNIAEYDDYEFLEKKMRSYWQRQQNTSYCLYGSKRHMMIDIFANPGKAFYKFGDLMFLEKIKTKDWIPFIIKNFKSTNKIISEELAEKIALLMKNQPWYVQQLSHYTWNISGKTAKIKDLQKALQELISANSPLFQKEIEILSATQTNLIKAILQGEEQFTSTATMQKYNLGTPRNVSKNKGVLIKSDIVQLVEKKMELLDPAFELWFKWQFFQVPIYNLKDK